MVVENEVLNAIKFYDCMNEASRLRNIGEELDESAFCISCSNVGRWAMDFTALRHLQYILANYPCIESILEFGYGTSTDVLIDFCLDLDKFVCYEHDENYVRSRCKETPDFLRLKPLQEIIYNGQKTLSYENNCAELLEENTKDLIVIDAPFGQEHYSRPQILFLLPKIINKDNFIIFMDDTNRQGEKETINEIFEILKSHNIPYFTESYLGEKEHTIICDINKKYLLSSL